MLDLDTFRALCQLVVVEQDPAKLEILKQRMRMLLAEGREQEHPAEAFVN
jgi:hypothetical protein